MLFVRTSTILSCAVVLGAAGRADAQCSSCFTNKIFCGLTNDSKAVVGLCDTAPKDCPTSIGSLANLYSTGLDKISATSSVECGPDTEDLAAANMIKTGKLVADGVSCDTCVDAEKNQVWCPYTNNASKEGGYCTTDSACVTLLPGENESITSGAKVEDVNDCPKSAGSACETCFEGSSANAKFCDYQDDGTSADKASTTLDVFYMCVDGDCPATVGSMDKVFGSFKVEAINAKSGCATGAGKDMPVEDVFKTDKPDETDCTTCLGTASYFWCTYSDGKKKGGYCTKEGDACGVAGASSLGPLASEKVTDKSKCNDTPTPAPPGGSCTTCLNDSNKVYCGYKIGETKMYYQCFDKTVATCPKLAGLEEMLVAANGSGSVTSDRVDAADNCAQWDSVATNLNLDVAASYTEAMNQKTCKECVKNYNFCNYVPKKDNKSSAAAGYCGAQTTCAALPELKNTKFTNDPKNPTKQCDASWGFGVQPTLVITAPIVMVAALLASM